ncbi:MAG TPA: hypothetical protein VLC46_16095 [Thermoanaerobaculia bacterium]|jgi:uncharacterized repeat protein (TIGR01451 family)|nr:hypothetical protein [Thermoanaerobaculia bacterium]
MKRVAVVVALVLLSCSVLYADISVTDRSTLHQIADTSALRPGVTAATPADRAARHAAAVADNKAKRDAKRARQHAHGKGRASALALHPGTLATGSIKLIDAAGLQYFINTDITFSTTSSASGAASEASYSAAVAATTLNGGTTMSTLNDEFDGYQTICVSLSNANTQCETGNAAFAIYNKNGPPAFDATVPPGPTCTNRQVVFPNQTIGPLTVFRKVFVPTNDTFIRWMNFFTNTSGSPVTFTMLTSNNLGSDSNTVIVNSSNGDAVADVTDTWITSFQNYSGTTSSDVRTGAVIQGAGAPTPVSTIFFANGNDNPFWVYSITLAPGQTKAILNFATGQPSKAAANAKSAALALLPASSTQCLSATELGQVVNFVTSTDLSITKSTTATIAFGGNPITYTLAVSNLGPATASSVSVSDTLPAGSGFVSASGTGWTCNNVGGTVTCTLPTLAVGAANPITLTITAPVVASPGNLSNTATVSSSASDPNPANNSSTKTVPILPGSSIPALSTWMLMMLATVLGAIALVRRT